VLGDRITKGRKVRENSNKRAEIMRKMPNSG
jgi:hypothetical protein